MIVKGVLIALGLIAAAAGQSCVAPFVPLAGKCFYLELSEQGSSYTWQDARDYCKALGGDLNADLASFPTCDEFTQFARYVAINAPSNKTIWMGALTAFSVNMWQWVTLESLETGVPFWYHAERFQNGYECAASHSDYYSRLVATDCNDQNAFACTYTPAGAAKLQQEVKAPIIRPSCPNQGIAIGDFCYVFYDATENFDNAEVKCGADHNPYGGILYYPANCEEFAQVAHHLETSEDLRQYWVGAVDISGQQEWFWVNGDNVPGGHPYWSTGQPSHEHENGPREHCASMYHENRFYLHDDHCSESFYFICKLQLV